MKLNTKHIKMPDKFYKSVPTQKEKNCSGDAPNAREALSARDIGIL
jgi:hypothetical protein